VSIIEELKYLDQPVRMHSRETMEELQYQFFFNQDMHINIFMNITNIAIPALNLQRYKRMWIK